MIRTGSQDAGALMGMGKGRDNRLVGVGLKSGTVCRRLGHAEKEEGLNDIPVKPKGLV